MQKTVLVTGGAGFIGSHACKALARAGYRPVAFDNLERGHAWAVKWGPLSCGDVRNAGDLRAVFAEFCPDAVMHFAAYAYVGESNLDPLKYYDNNVGGVIALVRACVEFNCRRVVFSSSCAIYGTAESGPIKESAPLSPINPYGWSKLMGERVLSDAARAHRLRYVALRYFNAAGSDPDVEIGESHEPETHLLPLAIGAALRLRPPLCLFGDDYTTKDGTCVRDFVHVCDLADAHVAALDLLNAGEAACAEAFNLCNERGYSVAEVIETVEKVLGKRVPVERRPRRPGDPPILIGRSTRAREHIGWRPKYADLHTQVEHAARWLESGRLS